jgi:hypothetical protein
MLILYDLGFLSCLTALAPRSVSNSWHFLDWSSRLAISRTWAGEDCELGSDRDAAAALACGAQVWEPAVMNSRGGRRAHRPGAAVLALLVVTAAAALALTLYYHLGTAGVVGVAITILLGLPALYLGWIPLGEARRQRDLSLAEIADGLAARLRSQWAREAEARGLNDPYPLPVTWTAADPPLAGDLEALKRLAVSGAGWSAQGRKNWARVPGDLAGGGDRKLADVLAAVPTSRLVVLGEPGSGKTMLMVGLVLDLLNPDRRGSGGPVPVLASLASWNPASQNLHGWLAATLTTDYPDLGAAPPPGSAGRNRFEALLEAGLILPVLDGLDEIAESARPAAITLINKELKPGERAVITCRTEQYKAAVSPPGGRGNALRAAAVQLNTLGFDEVASYLRQDAGPAKDRWDFLNTLSTESPARQALATPLMIALARAIYNPRPDERAGDLPHPAKLRGSADRAAVEAHLFDAFIPAAYRPPAQGRWTARQAETWLAFLARHLEQTVGSPGLAWWQLQQTAPFSLIPGVVAGLVAGLGLGLVFGQAAGLAFGVVVGLAGWLRAAPEIGGAETPARGVRISTDGLTAGLTAGLAAGLAGGLAAVLAIVLGARHRFGLVHGLEFGLVGGLGLGLVFGLVFGLKGVPRNLVEAASPRAVLARDRQVALLLTFIFGLAAWLAAWLSGGLLARLGSGLVGGLAAGLMFSMFQTAWPSYMLARGWLAFHHHLPWALMSFLADAHQRGVLRQAGAVYQFRHIELQHRLATRPSGPHPGPAPGPPDRLGGG